MTQTNLDLTQMNKTEKELIEKIDWKEQVKGSIRTAALNNRNVDAINETENTLVEFLEYKFEEAIRTAVEKRDAEIKAIATCEEIQGCDYVVIPLAKWQALKGETKKTEVNLSYCNKKDKRSCCG